MSKLSKISVLFIGALVLLFVWFYYGAGLSEESSYKLAVDRATQYSKENFIDLNNYTKPELGQQKGSRLFTFTWKPKVENGDKPFSVIVDPTIVEVYVDE